MVKLSKSKNADRAEASEPAPKLHVNPNSASRPTLKTYELPAPDVQRIRVQVSLYPDDNFVSHRYFVGKIQVAFARVPKEKGFPYMLWLTTVPSEFQFKTLSELEQAVRAALSG